MIFVLDLGIGNPLAVLRMVERAGGRATLSRSGADLTTSSAVVVPGVGSFDAGMVALRQRGFDEALRRIALGGEGRILGLCLGMQLLFDGSAEGSHPGLGIVPGYCRPIPSSRDVYVPHMGWNRVTVERMSPTTARLPADARFYFAHGFFAEPADPSCVTLSVVHGRSFCAAIEVANVVGAQFHPEKSHRFGLEFVKGFVTR